MGLNHHNAVWKCAETILIWIFLWSWWYSCLWWCNWIAAAPIFIMQISANAFALQSQPSLKLGILWHQSNNKQLYYRSLSFNKNIKIEVIKLPSLREKHSIKYLLYIYIYLYIHIGDWVCISRTHPIILHSGLPHFHPLIIGLQEHIDKDSILAGVNVITSGCIISYLLRLR